MLSRICQSIRRKLNDVDSLYSCGYIDNRGLQPYPRSSTPKSKNNNSKTK